MRSPRCLPPAPSPALRDVTLDDKYDARIRPRLPDRHAGAGPPADAAAPARPARRPQHRAASSPAIAARRSAASTRRCGRRRSSSTAHNIKFQPGLNEDLAATAIWGTQQVNLYPGREVRRRVRDVVRQGPGRGPLRRRVQARQLRRHVEARRRAGARRRRPRGQVLDAAAPVRARVLGGDDAGAVSVGGAGDPRPRPARLGDARYSGCWVGFKCVADTVESSASVYVDPDARARSSCPTTSRCRRTACHIRWPDAFLEHEARMQDYKIYAALHYCRANQLNRIVIDSPEAAARHHHPGKSYLDVRQALDDLGIDEADAAEIGMRVYKVAMPWPLEPEGVRAVRRRPRGNPGRRGKAPAHRVPAEGTALQLARRRAPARGRQVRREGRMGAPARRLAAARRRRAHAGDDRARDRASASSACDLHPRTIGAAARARRLDQRQGSGARQAARSTSCASRTSARAARTTPRPACPKAAARPPASAATYMAIWMDRSTSDLHAHGRRRRALDRPGAVHRTRSTSSRTSATAPTSTAGSWRSAPRSPPSVNITYKILYNDAVAMTGGQPVDGPLTPREIARQVAAEGVKRIVVVTDEPEKYPAGYFAGDIAHPPPRRARRRAARAARDRRACTVLIYDQTCAAEKRRRRKRGKFPDPAKRVVINELVCEGCGDCGVQVELRVGRAGRDRVRPQAHDRPVVVQQGLLLRQGLLPELRHRRRRHAAQAEEGRGGRLLRRCPTPSLPSTRRAVRHPGHRHRRHRRGHHRRAARHGRAPRRQGLQRARHDRPRAEERRGHVARAHRATRRSSMHATRIAAGEAKLVLGCDILTGVGYEALAKMQKGVTKALVNTALVMPAQFTREPDLALPAGLDGAGDQGRGRRPATPSSSTPPSSRPALMGDSIATNLFMLGYACQHGLVPLSAKRRSCARSS